MGGILQEGSKRRQTGVAAARTVLTILLQMVEEAQEQSGVDSPNANAVGALPILASAKLSKSRNVSR